MYRAIEFFTDLQDKNHSYNVGDVFPREGLEVSEERIAELSGKDNKRGKPLIKKEEQKEEKAPAKKAATKKAVAKK